MKKIFITACLMIAIITPFSSTEAQLSNTWINLYGSALFPTGRFDEIADEGYGGGFGIGTFINPNLLLKVMAAYHDFGSQTIIGDQKIDGGYAPLELGANFYLGFPGGIRPYFTAHGGWFVATGDFRDSDFGLGGGLGIEIPLGSPRINLQIEPNYNIVFQSDNQEYWSINVGLTFNLSPPSPIGRR